MAGFLSSIFGSKPTVPNLPVLDLGTEQQKAIGANKAALPGAEALVGQANLFSQDQITQMLKSVIPGFSGMTATATSNIASMLKGEIPEDVSQAAMRADAAKSLGGGYAGSGMHGDLVARDLGLTSLQLTQQGLTSAESWMSGMAKLYEPGMMNVSSMFITPQQQAAFDTEQTQAQFQRSWMQSQISALPDPVMRGMFDSINNLVFGAMGMMGGSGQNPGTSQGQPGQYADVGTGMSWAAGDGSDDIFGLGGGGGGMMGLLM